MEPKVVILYALVGVTILTALAVISAALGLFPGSAPQLVTWGLPAVLGEIGLTVIVILKAEWGSRVDVNLSFVDIDFLDIDFDAPNCHYKVLDSTGKEVGAGNIHPALGQGGWAVQIPVNVKSDHSVSLQFLTTSGESWTVQPFLPLVHTRNVVKIA